ncbi:Mechanosensitive ion channel-domain-containing protein [Protomyces lactucae-debilis]|uniref:Mechanosensitive ion channel-domain-containing protein n=1 Tax=Protomyces lactucae-debilis TaxID=2754530 RepID=A0A1Y2F684_PROLT|nr:Mechanosensitive ion channel-domain-containing protein [Protomyces lactucae-debilis]ORY79418.1 Mechanosensitive ion channel-domain-containing protein [Protomyces lactucae-debilis]
MEKRSFESGDTSKEPSDGTAYQHEPKQPRPGSPASQQDTDAHAFRDRSGSNHSKVSRASNKQSRTQQYAEQDAENIRAAERDASRMAASRVRTGSMRPNNHGDLEKHQEDDNDDTLHEHDGDSFDARADRPAHMPMSSRMRPAKRPLTALGKIFSWIHNFSTVTRWFLYITPVALILLIPILVGALKRTVDGQRLSVAGVDLEWFAIWWMIIWLTLWAGKFAAKLVPYIVGPVFSIFTNSYKKWRDLAIALSVPLSLFFWWLGIYISFLPIVEGHQIGYTGRQDWQTTLNRIILAVFIGTCLNLVEKFLMQLVAIGFHQRQYEDRIVLNKFQIASLTKLYRYSRETDRLAVDNDMADDQQQALSGSGTRTPNAALNLAGRVVQKTARDVVGRVAGELGGKRMEHSTSPRQMVLALLETTSGAQTLARRLFKSYSRDGREFIQREEMRDAFSEDEEADASFSMFDKDWNGDVTCEEMEIACVEIGKERKSITASLKDLDHAVSKLDDICTVVVAVIVVLIFIVLISRSFAGVLTSAGTTLLGLSWLFSQLAQEFLASIVFVFVKHPMDVGDRVDVLMNGEVQSLIVKEISLMATEFRKLDGRIVQAPNNVLNQLFILNMRRTGGVAEGVPTTLRFGVSIELIDALRQSMLEFVRSEPRDYKPDILTELTDIPNLTAVKLTIIFFHKQNWQNEGLRIGRRNKFMCALMVNVQRLGIESSIYNGPGGTMNTPMYISYPQSGQQPGVQSFNPHGQPFNPLTSNKEQNAAIDQVLSPSNDCAVDDDWQNESTAQGPSSALPDNYRPTQTPMSRRRGPGVGRQSSVTQHMAKVDYSLGATDFAQSAANDFFEESQERGLAAVLEVAEEAEERAQKERFERDKAMRKSNSRARTSSDLPGPATSGNNLQRSNTGLSQLSSAGTTRRNRFRLMGGRGGNINSARTMLQFDEEAQYPLAGDANGGPLDRLRSNESVASAGRSSFERRGSMLSRLGRQRTNNTQAPPESPAIQTPRPVPSALQTERRDMSVIMENPAELAFLREQVARTPSPGLEEKTMPTTTAATSHRQSLPRIITQIQPERSLSPKTPQP